jgi:hypothetical protein
MQKMPRRPENLPVITFQFRFLNIHDKSLNFFRAYIETNWMLRHS